MTRDETREKVMEILRQLAPDADLDALKPDSSLRKELAADSMDVLNFVVAVYGELGVEIPEQDYARIDRLQDCVDYIVAAVAAREAKRSR